MRSVCCGADAVIEQILPESIECTLSMLGSFKMFGIGENRVAQLQRGVGDGVMLRIPPIFSYIYYNVCVVVLLKVECPRPVLLGGCFGKDALAEGRVGGYTPCDALVLACVKRHADEAEEHHCHDAEFAVLIGVRSSDVEEREGKDDAAEGEQNCHAHVADKQIRHNHAQGEGDDEADEWVVLPEHEIRIDG